jgi:hypothetical protein
MLCVFQPVPELTEPLPEVVELVAVLAVVLDGASCPAALEPMLEAESEVALEVVLRPAPERAAPTVPLQR